MTLPHYTKEEIDQYIEYSHKLYSSVVERFMPKVDLESSVNSHDLNRYGEKIGNSLGIQQIISEVYGQLHESFGTWLYHDCLYTDHKGHDLPKVSTGYNPNTLRGSF